MIAKVDSLARWLAAPFAALAMQLSEAADFYVNASDSGSAPTSEIQRCVDAASAAGGGRVVLREGVHPCGTLHLKSNVELHLEKGAVLFGGARPEDYEDIVDPLVDVAPEESRKAFLVCIGATNVAVSGRGVIDGRGVGFYDSEIKPGSRFFSKPPCPRPRMVQFFRVAGVRFEGVTLKDSPGWTAWLRECEDVVFSRVKIVGDQRMINNDGIDFDSCRRMRVSDCDISTGDDCIVMRAIRCGGRPAVCEDLVVRNCRLSSACQGVRLGCPSDDTIRRARFVDCTFSGHNGILSYHPYHYLRDGDAGFCRMEDIVFSGWKIDSSGSAIFFKAEGGIRLRDFGHVAFKDMEIRSKHPITLLGTAETPLKDVRFENVRVDVAAGEPVRMNAASQIAFDRFTVSSGPGEPKPFARRGGSSWESKKASAEVVREVRVSDFGFSPEDSTVFLQKALDSGAGRVVIDRREGPWISRPLFVRKPGMELVFEKGVELVAKKGEFAGLTDSLIQVGRGMRIKIVGNGATLRMHRDDYLKRPYARGEWRHAIAFNDTDGTTIEGLNIVDSGGDAIYLGATPRGACKNVTIRGILAKGNLRQGISVISAENLLIEDCVFEETCGLPPMAGIDFEPNFPGQRLVNCTVRNCVSRRNFGYGWDIVVCNLDSTSRPLSVLFEGCREEDNSGSLRVWCENRDFDNVRGEVRFSNCSFARPRVSTFTFAQNPDLPVNIAFDTCSYTPNGAAAPGEMPDWKVSNLAPVLSGATVAVRTVANADMSGAVISDEHPGEMLPLSVFNVRFSGRYLFYADRAREVRFRGRQFRIGGGKSAPTESGIVVKDAADNVLGKVSMPKFEDTEFSVAVPSAGFYTLNFNAQPSPFALTAADAPVALDLEKGRICIINSSGALRFSVAEGSEAFAVIACGSKSERVHIRLLAPDGAAEWDCDNIDRSFRHAVANPSPGTWTIRVSRPSAGSFEDYKLDLAGVPPHLFLCGERTWTATARPATRKDGAR